MITELGQPRIVVETALLATGPPSDICRAGPGDLVAVRTFYERLGDTSTYDRFFGLCRALLDGELRHSSATAPNTSSCSPPSVIA